MNIERPYTLSIAGFDPSGGAGILADIKTFEANAVLGLGVCTAITYQNEHSFDGLDWINLDQLIKQLDPLYRQYPIAHVKIGIIQDMETLYRLVSWIKNKNPQTKIVWDPVLKASAGFTFHDHIGKVILEKILSSISLITPNLLEVTALSGNENVDEAVPYLSRFCSVLLKGGHSEEKEAADILFHKGKQYTFKHAWIEGDGKHGSGCVLSAAITAYLALGDTLPAACEKGKHYITQFIQSTPTLLGYHIHDN